MKRKTKMILSIIGFVISMGLLVLASILYESKSINPDSATAFMVIATILLMIAVVILAKSEYEMGIYECRNCGNTFKPSFKEYLFGPHIFTTRNLKCPECNKRTWCKYRIIK